MKKSNRTWVMAKRREIDKRDVDQILSALTDLQIAELFGMPETEVSQLRQERKSMPTKPDEEDRKGFKQEN